jgi:hypothetical protein
MFSSNLSRGPFFLYTILIGLVELILIVSYVALTWGWLEFVNSKPGPGREGLTFGIFILGVICAIARGNIAIRRNRDRAGGKAFMWGYICLLVMLAIFTPFEFLFYKFGANDNGNPGLGILGFISLVMWFRLVISGTQSLDGVDREIAEMAKRYGGADTPRPQNFAPSPAQSTPSNGPTVFGKRN